MNYKEFFNNKKIAVIGLGPHGEMISDIKFLLRSKSYVTLYDMRSDRRLRKFLPELKDAGLKDYFFGKIDEMDLLKFDLILLSPEISKKSFFLKKVISAEIPIEYPDTLFFKLSPPITLIGVLGLYGKTMVTQMLYIMLKKAFAEYKDQGLFLIDPDGTSGALTHLKKIKKNDLVLARIPESLVQHYYEIHISPHVAVITSPINFNILNFQTYNNFIVANDDVIDALKLEKEFFSKAKILRTRPGLIPNDWSIESRFLHNRENMALVFQTSELFKIPINIVKEVMQEFFGTKGCIEFIKKVNKVEFYNDSNSITPNSTLAALRSLATNKNIILIMGGAYTGHDYSLLIENISQYVSTIILLPGSGTLGIRPSLEKIEDIKVIQVLNLEDAVEEANKNAKKDSLVLFSPAFDAVGVDTSRKERGERFVKAVRSL